MKKAVVIGSGAGGATAAKELQGKFAVTVLEAGKQFRPFMTDLSFVERFKKAGLLFDERMTRFLFPAMKTRKANGDLVVINGVGTGGTTTICTGNALRCDEGLKAIGIDLDREFDELMGEIPISNDHWRYWREHTRDAFRVCEEMDLQPLPSPKMAYGDRCVGCGMCMFGCRHGAKWDSREFLDAAVKKGATVISDARVKRVVISGGESLGVVVSGSASPAFLPADLVVVAAGGLGTPVILSESGIECKQRLFIDPVLCVAARWEGSEQNREIPMPFIVQRDHFIISPYFDFLSFFFNRKWKYGADGIYSLMIKLADANSGSVSGARITKKLGEEDRKRLDDGVSLCKEIFRRLGRRGEDLFLGTLNGGHPGGMMPLTVEEADNFHSSSLPENVYVADASLFPESLGNPPILTIMAMAKRVSRKCLALA